METQTIEYKQTWRDDFLKEICGFANAQGGTLYIGIADNGEVVGVDNPLGIDMKAYGLTSNMNELKMLTKKCNSNKDPRFTRLAIALRISPEIKALEESLKYMVDNKYDVDNKELEQIFLN